MAQTLTAENPGPAGISQVAAEAAQDAQHFSSTGDMMAARMPDLVKGAGFAPKGGNQPLADQGDILTRSAQAALDLRVATKQGLSNKSGVVKSLNPSFLSQFGYLATALSQPSIAEQLQQFMGAVATPDVARSFTAGNLGIGSVYGNVPSSSWAAA